MKVNKMVLDDKKIEEAAKDYINKNNYFAKYEEDPCVDIEFAYKDGAHWAINESLKDLWHPSSEKPKKGRVFLYKTIFKGYGVNQIFDKDANKITLAGYIVYLQGMYKRYGNISIAQLKHIERNWKKEDKR